MSRASVCVFALLALSCLALSSSARLGGWDNPLASSKDGFESLELKLRSAARTKSMLHDDPNRKRDSEADEWLDKNAFVAVKYKVPPSMHDKFMDEWRDLYKDVDKMEDHNILYTLSKTMQDNIYFTTYGEWDTMAAYIEHFYSDHVKDFLGWLEDNDVTWELFPLSNVTDIKHETRKYRGSAAAASSEEDNKRKRKDMVHIRFQYHVEPSVIKDFVDTWEDMADKVWDEKGNAVYALRKMTTNNHHFFACGSWDSWSDFMDHIESKHVERFMDFLEKEDIMIMWEPVLNMEGDTPE